MKSRLSPLIIIYQGRYIRRFIDSVYNSPAYVVTWAGGSRERRIYYGSLEDLIREIADTVKFFGKWEFLI